MELLMALAGFFTEKEIIELVDKKYKKMMEEKIKTAIGNELLSWIENFSYLQALYTVNKEEFLWIDRIVKNVDNAFCFVKEACSHEAKEELGLYLVGSTFFNPHTKEEFYWIKVGKSTNIAKRMKNYATHNPMLWKQSFYYCETKEEMDRKEHYCHKMLENVDLAHTTEWFQVSRETYLEICDTEWNFFNK